MTRADMRAMQTIRDRVLGSIVLPPGRFFTPKPAFWEAMKELTAGVTGLAIMDCGCGTGDLIQEGHDHGLHIMGCDTMKRDGQSVRVVSLDATKIRWAHNYWPLICRPDHSGWATDVVSNAILQGARAIYVSKPSNFHRDVGGMAIKRFARNVGEDGETMYVTE